MSQPTEKPSELSLVEFDSTALLQVDPNKMTNEELIASIKKLQNLRAGPHELKREKTKSKAKAQGTYVDALAGL